MNIALPTLNRLLNDNVLEIKFLVSFPPSVPGALPSNSSDASVEIQYLNLPSVVSLNESEQLEKRTKDTDSKRNK